MKPKQVAAQLYTCRDLLEIIPAAEATGCSWFIVEQDVTPGDSLAQSYDYLCE